MPSREEDLDWLYGRDSAADSGPEPTRLLPGAGAEAGTRLEPPSGPPTGTRPPAAGPAGGFDYSGPPLYRAGPPAGQPPAGPGLPPAGPGLPPDYPPAPHYTRPAAAPSPARGAGPVLPPPGAPPARSGRPAKRRRPARTVLLTVLVLVLAGLVWLIGVPLHAWSQVARVDAAPDGDRPGRQPGTTFLLVGSDSREGLSDAERKQLGTGSTGGQRTDTMMIMYVPPGGRPALISIPRDSYVPIPGNGSNKINAAYAFGGPKLLVETVEQSTGLRIDGYMEIGFGGFVNIIDSLGGIRMCLPAAIKDADSKLDLGKGCQTLDGTDALGYVRMRKADPRGDLGRVDRQREMLAAVAKKAATPATVVNPVRYWRVTHAVTDAIALGEDTSLFETSRMGLAMRKVANEQGLTLTVPVASTDASTPAGSAVLWDKQRAEAMFDDIARGDTSKLDKYAK